MQPSPPPGVSSRGSRQLGHVGVSLANGTLGIKVKVMSKSSLHLALHFSIWSDFDDCHNGRFCVSLQTSVPVHSNMVGQNNGQSLRRKPRRHNANRFLFRVREQIINGLVWNKSISSIARALHVSRNTVAAIRDRGG
jgi:hypothetical protein